MKEHGLLRNAGFVYLIGKLDDWQAVSLQRRLETNAWLTRLRDRDSYGSVTSAQGIEANVAVGLVKNLSLGFDYYSMDTINGASAPKSLLQTDLVYKC